MTGIPWRVGTPRCGADVSTGAGGAPRQCNAPVTHAGIVLQHEPLAAWRAFACREHRGGLSNARRLLDRDRAVLDDWQIRERRALNGKDSEPPQPLAVGAAAWELVRRAGADE